MLQVEVAFDFQCCACGSDMGVTLRCAGEGLADNPMTSVKVPCPTCHRNNQLLFSPDGTLHRVAPDRQRLCVPTPSCN